MPTIVLVGSIAASIACGASGVDLSLTARDATSAVYQLAMTQCGDTVGPEGTVMQYMFCLAQKGWGVVWEYALPTEEPNGGA